MLIFRPLSLDDKALIQQYTLVCDYKNCDLSFANLYGWRTHYGTEVAVYKGFLLLRFHTHHHQAYMMPLGSGDLGEVIEVMIADAHMLNRPFLLLSVNRPMVDELEAIMPDRFCFTTNRDFSDYIYLRSDLEQLTGKRMQAKRNHVNRFKRDYPNSVYRPLCAEMIDECLALDSVWIDSRMSVENENMQAEREAMEHVLTHIDALEVIGGALFVEDKMVAFCYGGAINHDTVDICVEVAERN